MSLRTRKSLYVKLALLTAAAAAFAGAVDDAVAQVPVDPGIAQAIQKFNEYRNNTFIPNQVARRAFMPKMKEDKPLMPGMEIKMKAAVKPYMIKKVQEDIKQPTTPDALPPAGSNPESWWQ